MSTIEPIILLLAFLWIIGLGACFGAEFFFRSDNSFFMSIIGMTTTILGGLMLKITGKEHPILPPGTIQQTSTTQQTQVVPVDENAQKEK